MTEKASVGKAVGLEQVQFEAPDLDQMERFLGDFGLDRIRRSDTTLEMGAAGAARPCHVTCTGEAGFSGFRLAVEDGEEVRQLAAAAESEIGETEGRLMTVLRDPDGFRVEVVAPPIDAQGSASAGSGEWNNAEARRRLGERREAEPRRASVYRLGHLVLEVADFQRSLDWYQRHFGLLVSDWVVLPDSDVRFGAFLRCDQGDTPVDHHTVVLLGLGHAKFGHAAFEVLDIDDLMFGHDHLKAQEYPHAWGIGRHIMGSQVFDYWLDPWGHMLEHWTDGDQLVAESPALTRPAGDLIATQWGPHLQLPEGG